MEFDVRLECARCGRHLVIDDLPPHQLTSIGRAHGAEFSAALVKCANLGLRVHNKREHE